MANKNEAACCEVASSCPRGAEDKDHPVLRSSDAPTKKTCMVSEDEFVAESKITRGAGPKSTVEQILFYFSTILHEN